MERTTRRTDGRLAGRRGLILYVVLFVVMMVGLLAASLNFYIRSQLSSAVADRQEAQATEAARAGVAYFCALALDGTQAGVDLRNNPELFHGVSLSTGSTIAAGQGLGGGGDWQFSLIRDDLDDDKAPAYGVADESGKLNLNQIADTAKVSEDQAMKMLLALPDMTPEIAAAILDWRDADETVRAGGAETEYYSNLVHPYSAKNGPFESVEELLLVRGVTEQLLYGNDLNRNGLLEPNENDGDKSLPPDPADGKLHPGWAAYLTVCSGEPNKTHDLRTRLNITTSAPDQVYQKMVDRGFRPEVADFVRNARNAGYRFKDPGELIGSISIGGGSGGSGVPRNIRVVPDGSAVPPDGSSGPRIRRGGGTGDLRSDLWPAPSVDLLAMPDVGRLMMPPVRLAQTTPRDDTAGPDGSGDSGDRGRRPGRDGRGDRAGRGGRFGGGVDDGDATSPAGRGRRGRGPRGGLTNRDLTVTRVGGGGSAPRVMDSPLKPDELAQALEELTCSSQSIVFGKVNPSVAPLLVLEAIGFETEEASAAVREQRSLSGAEQQTHAWLITHGVLSVERFHALSPLLCGRGWQFRVESVGYSRQLGLFHRAEAVVDLSSGAPRTVYCRDLTPLGPAYVLDGEGDQTPSR